MSKAIGIIIEEDSGKNPLLLLFNKNRVDIGLLCIFKV